MWLLCTEGFYALNCQGNTFLKNGLGATSYVLRNVTSRIKPYWPEDTRSDTLGSITPTWQRQSSRGDISGLSTQACYNNLPKCSRLLLQYHTTTSLQSEILFKIIFYTTTNQQDPTSMRSVLDDLLYIYNHHNGIGGDTKIRY